MLECTCCASSARDLGCPLFLSVTFRGGKHWDCQSFLWLIFQNVSDQCFPHVCNSSALFGELDANGKAPRHSSRISTFPTVDNKEFPGGPSQAQFPWPSISCILADGHFLIDSASSSIILSVKVPAMSTLLPPLRSLAESYPCGVVLCYERPLPKLARLSISLLFVVDAPS